MVRKVQSCCSLLGLRVIGSSTAAYCAARKRFKYTDLLGIHKAVTGSIQSSSPSESLCKGLDVKVVDGTGIAMPDTPENQSEFPQPSLQKPGCGFPVITLVACFSWLAVLCCIGSSPHSRVMKAVYLERCWCVT